MSSTRAIVKEILGSPVPVIVYVAPSGAGAGSAGVFITLASHIAAMAPGTNIGAAHPVAGGGQEVKGVMGEKIENFTASFSEAIAQRRGRNTEFAIQAVRRSVSITDKEGFTGFNFIGLWIPVWLGLTSLEALSMMREAFTYFLTCPSSRVWGGVSIGWKAESWRVLIGRFPSKTQLNDALIES